MAFLFSNESIQRNPVPRPGGISISMQNSAPGLGRIWIFAQREYLVQVEADGNAIAGIASVIQIIAAIVVVHVYVVAVVPIV